MNDNNKLWSRRRAQADSNATLGSGRGRLRLRARPEVLLLEDRRLMTTIITVTNPADSGAGTLRDAVARADLATNPVEIDFHLKKGETEITLTTGQLELSNSVPITIDGPGSALLTVDGDQNSRVFQIDPNVTASISGLTISEGYIKTGIDFPYQGYPSGIGNDGGGLYNQGSLTLTGVTVSDNFAEDFGGGVANSPSNNASIAMTDCSITGNVAGTAGGVANGIETGVPDSGTMTLTGCTISDNTDYSNAGGILDCATATLEGCSISGNTCKTGNTGGIYMNFGDTLTLTDCSIDDNSGGGVEARYSNALTLTDCSVENNSYSSGVVTLALGQLTITGSTISANSGLFGGGVVAGGPTTITGSTISGNTGVRYGGGVVVEADSPATITGCTIRGNSTLYAESVETGGGLEIESGAVATITGCTIIGNSVGSSYGTGGGVGIDGLATLTDCTISGNSAAAGGGVFNYGTASLVACTVSGNSSPQGGGIDNYSSPYYTSRTTLTDTIVAFNSTGSGGAASDIGGTDPGDVTGSYNLIGTGGSGGLTSADHNLLNVANPGLAPLGDYGGPTETIALQPNSPAIHAGTAISGLITDQRGFALDNPPDIGAFQSQPGPLVVDTAIDGLGSGIGQLSLRQAVNLADVLTGGATITFDKSTFSAPTIIDLTSGQLELSNTTGPVNILGPGLGKLAISGAGVSRVFQVDKGASASLSGMTIIGGVTSGDGGGLLNFGSVTLTGDAIVGNSAADGGGIANSGTAVILGSSIDGNAATENGGGIFNTSALALSLSDLSANMAANDGGGLYNTGTAALVFCTVDDNSASAGGGIYADPSGSPVVLIGTEVKQNKGGNIFGRVINLL
jgi:fibronectin-binding autotransporter adhesin